MKGEVCAKDLLPEKKPLDMKANIVIQIYPQIQENIGWLSTSEEIKFIYFDSYGRPPEEQQFYHFLKETLQDGSIIQNVYRVHGAKYVECGVSTSFTSSTKD